MSDIRRFNNQRPFTENDFNSRIPRYNDDSDYTTNAPSYYDDLARKNALMKRLALRVWEYQELINKQFDEWDEELRKRFLAWDKNLEEFDDEVLKLLQQWLLDGTLDHIINETIFSWKADKVELDRVERETKEEFENVRNEIQEEIERLENETKQTFKDVRQENEQKDFVDIIRKYNNFNNMQIQKINSGQGIEVTLYDDQDQHITHQFVYNGAISLTERDEYFIHTRTWVGDYTKSFEKYKTLPLSELKKTGNFIPSTENSAGYTFNIGDSFTQVINVEENDGIALDFFANTNGGVWKIELVDTDFESVNLTTYSSNTFRQYYTPFKFLPAGEYTLKGTFMGDDPSNPPSSGTSRGWLASGSNNIVSLSKEFAIPEKLDDKLIKYPSNLEFAYNMKPKESDDYEFLPFHGVITAFQQYQIKMYDGSEIIDFNSMTDLSYRHINNVLRLEQKIYGRHSSSTSNLLEIMTYHTITRDGVIELDGKTKLLQPTYFTNSYVIMGVARAKLFNEVLTSYDNTYPNTSDQWLAGDNLTFLPEENDSCKSYAFIDSRNKNIAIAFTFNDIRQTLRKYSNDKDDPDYMTYIQHRNENLVKIYSRLWQPGNNLMPKGYVHVFSGKWVFSSQNNIYDIISLK